jgi:hypothetical protein
VRPTNVFAAPEVLTTPKRKRTIYGDRSSSQGMIADLVDSFQIERESIYKQVLVFLRAPMYPHRNLEENTVPEKLTLKEVENASF